MATKPIEERLKDFARAVYERLKDLYLKVDSKLDKKVDSSKSGELLSVDSEGDIITIEDTKVDKTSIDGKSYLQKDGEWVEYQEPSLSWDNISDKPEKFPFEDHDHNNDYYTKSEIDSKLASEGSSGGTEVDLSNYYTKTEVDSELVKKKNDFIENTGFNKNFGTESGTVSEGNHTHDDAYFSKDEIRLMFQNLNDSNNPGEIFYTKSEVDTFIQDLESSIGDVGSISYTKEEVDRFLSEKSELNHDHNLTYYSKVEVDEFIKALEDKMKTVGDIPIFYKPIADLKFNKSSNIDPSIGYTGDLILDLEYIKRDGGELNKVSLYSSEDDQDFLREFTKPELDSLGNILTINDFEFKNLNYIYWKVEYLKGDTIKTNSDQVDFPSDIPSGSINGKVEFSLDYSIKTYSGTSISVNFDSDYNDLSVINKVGLVTLNLGELYLQVYIKKGQEFWEIRDSSLDFNIIPSMSYEDLGEYSLYTYSLDVPYLETKVFEIEMR